MQIGVWLITLHSAPAPQEPGQGSRHFSLIQDKILGHSALMVHSGLQLGGEPAYSGKQEHDGIPPLSLHCEYGPHGEGRHGSVITWTGLVGGGAE